MFLYVNRLFCFKKSRYLIFFCRYHLQLHWRCWRAVPAHLWLWLHRTWCQYHCCMCKYNNGLFYIEKRRFSLFQLQIPSAAALKLLQALAAHLGSWMHVKGCQHFFYMCTYVDCLFSFEKSRFSLFFCRYHLQLHWSCWRAVPGHHGLRLHGTWCQFHCCMCMYDNCLFYIKKKRFSLFQLQIPYAAALKLLTSCSSTSWVINAWNLTSLLLLHVYVHLFSIKKTDFHYFSYK